MARTTARGGVYLDTQQGKERIVIKKKKILRDQQLLNATEPVPWPRNAECPKTGAADKNRAAALRTMMDFD